MVILFLGFNVLIAVGGIAVIARGFSGNQYLCQSKKTSQRWLQFGKLGRSYGLVTMGECMKQFVGLTGVRSFKGL